MQGHISMRGWRSVSVLLVLSVVSSGLLQMVRGQASLFTYSDFGLDWNGTCKTGLRQSPINLDHSMFTRTAAAISPTVPFGSFGTGTNVSVQHLGNQVTVAWKQADPSTVTMTLGAFYAQPGATGVLNVPGTNIVAGPAETVMSVTPTQFHFHTNSEHTFDGLYSILEAHMVTNVTAANTSCPPTKPCVAVYGVLYPYSPDGLVDNEFLATFFDNIPKADASLDSRTYLPADYVLNLTDYFPEDTSKYIQYPGSFTTPPCTENVLWTMFEATRPISFPQTQQLSRALSQAVVDGLVATRTANRFPQLSNNRTIWYFDTVSLSGPGLREGL